MKNKYMPAAISLYINYIIQGISAIILAQNMEFLTGQFHTDKAGVAYVISGLGIGKLLVLFISGVLSDRFGRKPFVLLGIAGYVVFFAGILFSPNVAVAFIFAVIAGIANSFLDSGTYPALMETFPNATGTANIIIKAFVALGQFSLPLMISFVVSNNLYFGYTFYVCIGALLINGIFVLRQKYPPMNVAKPAAAAGGEETVKANFWIEGLALILIGFTSTATFFIISVWLPTYGQEAAGMAANASRQLISYYSIGSLVAVFITAVLVKKWVKPATFILIYPLISLACLFLLWANPTPAIAVFSAFVIGFTAAGGVLQLALTTMAELFPSSKGKITGSVYTLCSLATFVCPVVTGRLAESNIKNVLVFNMANTAVGVILAVIVLIRYRKVFKTHNMQKAA
ncbi:Sugar phosphate permease [Paenibacillus sophorae]|uniref:MFS transporter n=1 Tax=Paenibacillus sophorae TaxID=1333845 RepID=A0A1H8R1I5_9BACL|nr:MFS transporter [Paenibacillus sophorae]QWU14907.1 MFS transporter [Paenibacillus sophorae]SEO60137.1 Sugar phosphate permease [Paenibacillus sophorae]